MLAHWTTDVLADRVMGGLLELCLAPLSGRSRWSFCAEPDASGTPCRSPALTDAVKDGSSSDRPLNQAAHSSNAHSSGTSQQDACWSPSPHLQEITHVPKFDKLQIELPLPKEPEPNAAAALQELLGGKYGEMSTLGNYLFQSFNFRSKSKLKPFYSLVANITAEELGHVELVSNGVALLNNGPGAPDEVEPDISNAPFADMKDIRLPHRSCQTAAAPCR